MSETITFPESRLQVAKRRRKKAAPNPSAVLDGVSGSSWTRRINTITNSLAQGNSLRVAAMLAGLPEKKLAEWIRIGADEIEAHYDNSAEELDLTNAKDFALLTLKVREALALAEASDVAKVNAAIAQGNIKALMFKMERRWKEDWGQKNSQEVKHTHDEQQVTHTHVVLPAESPSIEQWNASRQQDKPVLDVTDQ